MRLISRRPTAIARIRGGRQYPLLMGTAWFYQLPNGVLVETEISGLPANGAGFYGFHIHTGRVCGDRDFAATGGHYAPADTLHPKHAGDLPPLLSNNGNAYMAVVTDRFSIPEIINRTVVVHSDPDDLHTQPAGNTGQKIGCGVIEYFGSRRPRRNM